MTETTHIEDVDAVDPLQRLRARAARTMSVVLAIHLVYGLVLTPWYDTYFVFLVVAIPVGVLTLWFNRRAPLATVTRMVVAAAFMVLSAVAVQQAHGLIHTHFGFFVLLTLLVAYRDWRVYLVAFAVAMAYFVIGGYLQQAGYGVYCCAEADWNVVALHVCALGFAAGGLGCMAEVMRREVSITGDLHATEDANRRLHAAEQKLASLNAGLESRIAQRTAELAAAKAAAEEANKAKTQFLSEMSHEIRMPLNNLVGTAELLQETSLSGEQRQYCDAIAASARALHNMFRGTLDMAKIDDGTLRMMTAAMPVTPAAAAPAPGSAEGRFAVRVLVAEDTRTHQDIMRAMLTRLGAEVTLVDNGELAVEAVRNGAYDLVLMDCQMPVLDGYAATTRIRALQDATPGAPRLPIVAVTAHALAEDRLRCIDAGMDDYVTKPVAFGDLRTVLARWTLR